MKNESDSNPIALVFLSTVNRQPSNGAVAVATENRGQTSPASGTLP